MWSAALTVLGVVIWSIIESGGNIWDMWPTIKKHPVGGGIMLAVMIALVTLMNLLWK